MKRGDPDEDLDTKERAALGGMMPLPQKGRHKVQVIMGGTLTDLVV